MLLQEISRQPDSKHGRALGAFGDAELKKFISNEKIWNKLSADTQAKIFLVRQGKALTLAYSKCTKDVQKLGIAVLNRLPDKSSVAECNAAAIFMAMFAQKIFADLLHQLYDTLKSIKAAARTVKTTAPAVLPLCWNSKPPTLPTSTPWRSSRWSKIKKRKNFIIASVKIL